MGVTMDLLGDGRVQAAVVQAVRAADDVELDHKKVLLTRQADSWGFKPQQLLDIDLAAVALAICIERWACDASPR